MKTTKYLFALLLLSVAGTSFAACPQSLSVEGMVECIVSEAATETQDDFRWDSVATVEKAEETVIESDQAVTFVAYDNE